MQYDIIFTDVTSGTALKTLAQVALGANITAKLVEWTVSFNGTNASAVPVLIQLNRQTTAGTGGVANTPAPRAGEPAASGMGLTALTGPTAATWTAEPTAGTVQFANRFTPVGLGPFAQYPYGREIPIPASGRLAIVITAAVAVVCSGHMCIEV